MNEREKIINIVEQNKYCDVNTAANCRECKYSKELENYKDMGCSSLKTADALIAAGIGDVTEWKERAERAERRAEVAERGLRRRCESEADNDCPCDENSDKCKECAEKRLCSTKYATQCYYERAIQQAEREIEEEKGE